MGHMSNLLKSNYELLGIICAFLCAYILKGIGLSMFFAFPISLLIGFTVAVIINSLNSKPA